jgi:hypothetical protein
VSGGVSGGERGLVGLIEGQELEVEVFEEKRESLIREEVESPEIGSPVGVNQPSPKGEETREDLEEVIGTEEERRRAREREGNRESMLCSGATRGGESEGEESDEESGYGDDNKCSKAKEKAPSTGER